MNRLSQPFKVVIGALTLWPFLYILIFIGVAFVSVVGARESGPSTGFPIGFALLFAAHFLTMLLMFGLVAFYVAFLFKTDRVPSDKKALWAVVLFLGNMIAMPVFFWFYVWPDGSDGASAS
jgi:hypothetical protein